MKMMESLQENKEKGKQLGTSKNARNRGAKEHKATPQIPQQCPWNNQRLQTARVVCKYL